jgi:glyoxylase-like metal-dependent hydrolase (beta-lactamase superfamily II)
MRYQRQAIGRDGPVTLTQSHAAYAEIGLIDPGGLGQCSCVIRPGETTRLSPRVQRLTAPNAGVMTGPGTNAYLIGVGDAIAVIDPGPVDDGHIAQFLALPDPIRWIFVTHTHRDHSPAAAVLKARTGALCFGMAPPEGPNQDHSFRPDIELAHGQMVEVSGCALTAIHTPGHASNHLCYWLAEDRMLFTGDHVMQGSTVVINPPDGDMAAYLASLRMLNAMAIDYFAPGHGFLIGEPRDMVERLLRHRLLRESKTMTALRRIAPATLDALVPAVYDDVPSAMHPWAARSLLAHLLKLESEGVACSRDGIWSVS